MLNKTIVCMLLFLLLSACPSEQPGGDAARKQSGASAGSAGEGSALQPAGTGPSIDIVPKDASCNPVFHVISRDSTLSSAHIEWLVNGSSIDGATGAQFQSLEMKKNDRVQARITVGQEAAWSDSVEVKNCPPQINTIKLMPEIFKPQDALTVEVTTKDIDGDAVQVLYAWSKNGKPAGEERLLAVPLQRGDTVSITVTPFDGEAYGEPAILKREILNYPPVIIEHSAYVLESNMLTYQTKAQDPDGDVLTYSLESAVKGMEIDPASGELRWSLPSEFKGKEKAAIVVSDGHGGTARYVLQITIQ